MNSARSAAALSSAAARNFIAAALRSASERTTTVSAGVALAATTGGRSCAAGREAIPYARAAGLMTAKAQAKLKVALDRCRIDTPPGPTPPGGVLCRDFQTLTNL